MTLQRLFIPIAVAIVAMASLVWVFIWPGSAAETQQIIDPEAISPVIGALGPNTELHAVEKVYRRYPPQGEIPAHVGPDTQTTTVSFSFDSDGRLQDYYGETRGQDGSLVQTQTLDGEDLVIRRADGTEQQRIEGFKRLHVNAVKEGFGQLTVAASNAVSQEDAATRELDGVPVYVLETRRQLQLSPNARVDGEPAVASGFSLPYIEDLSPVEEIRREFLLADEYRSVRTEVLIVGADGRETLVESREWLVFEVTSN